MRVLAGDVGGTNTRLALCEVEGNRVTRLAEEVRRSDSCGGLYEAAAEFLERHSLRPEAACFGLPGPVRGRTVQLLTNLPWEIDADELEARLGVPVFLLNDLEANAWGLATLGDEAFFVLHRGVPESGNAALLSAGTGLGEAILARIDGRLVPLASEGGHTDFAPETTLEIDLLLFLQAEFGPHVSWERVVSGPGLVNIYRFLRARAGDEPAELGAAFQTTDPAAAITAAALAGRDAACRAALDLFMELYGAQAGNLALTALATGGVYLGGGIAPRLAQELVASRFVERFRGKGRLRRIVERIPIRIVMDDKTALQGAAACAGALAVANGR
jgi:glucokinase